MRQDFAAHVESEAPALRFPAYPMAGLAGASFKPEHLPAILADRERRRFFEVHAENYMGAGGPPHRALEIIRRDYPVSLHGVCMSIGGPGALDKAHLERFRRLVERYEPALVSEHLAWSTHETAYFNDLLPLPYNERRLRRVCDHIDEVQEAIRRPILLENPSTYLVVPRIDNQRNGFHPRRSRSAPDAACCLTSTMSSSLRRIMASPRWTISRTSRCRMCRRDPSRRTCGAKRRRRRAAAHRQPRRPGGRCACGNSTRLFSHEWARSQR